MLIDNMQIHAVSLVWHPALGAFRSFFSGYSPYPVAEEWAISQVVKSR